MHGQTTDRCSNHTFNNVNKITMYNDSDTVALAVDADGQTIKFGNYASGAVGQAVFDATSGSQMLGFSSVPMGATNQMQAFTFNRACLNDKLKTPYGRSSAQQCYAEETYPHGNYMTGRN